MNICILKNIYILLLVLPKSYFFHELHRYIMYKYIKKFSNILVCIRVFAISTCHRKLSWRKSEITRTLVQVKNGASLFRLLYISWKVERQPFSSCIQDLICAIFLLRSQNHEKDSHAIIFFNYARHVDSTR